METRDMHTVGSLMHSGVVTCRPDDCLRTVAHLLAANRIHAIVVASPEECAPRAVVTDRDVVWVHSLGKLDDVLARDAASEPTVTVRADLDLRQACELMARYGTSHVVVTEPGYGAPVGILSSLDVAAAVTEPDA
jgi:predicted transcriptional regulator